MLSINKRSLLTFLPVVLALWCHQVNAGVTSSQVKHITYQVPINKSLLINLDKKVGKISKGNPGIANILLFPPNQIFLRGKSVGLTNAIIWDTNKKVSLVLDIEVTQNLDSLKQKLYELLPDERIEVRSAKRNIILSGEVSNIVKMDTAMKLAQGYITRSRRGGKGQKSGIINNMHVGGGQQIMLAVTVAEMERKIAKELSVRVGARGTDDNTFIFDAMSTAATVASGGLGSFAGAWLTGNTLITLQAEIKKNNGLVSILAEPNLTTVSGQKASFLSGGQFPYLGSCSQFFCSTAFKNFGVGLEFVPTVLDANRISLNTHVTVSQLSNEAAETTGVQTEEPSLSVREAQSTIELADGQTMSIAGMIAKNTRESSSKVPFLSDIPLIGMLWRDSEYRKEKKELVILVTPHLARPVPQDQIRLPTDGFVEPDDVDFYLLGRMESRKARARANTISSGAGGTEARFGHQVNYGNYQ